MPKLADLFRASLRALQMQIRTHVPARVVSYDATRQVATVEVQFLEVVPVLDLSRLPARMRSLKGTPPDAEATLQPLVLADIPVAWPRTLAGYVTFPLVAGDTGELHVHDRSLTTWLLAGIASDPILAHTHALQDGVFHPGLHAGTAPISPATDQTAAVMHGDAIKLNRAATDFVALSNPTGIQFATLKTAINGWTPVAGDGGAALKTALGAWIASSSNVAATTVKAL